MAKFKGRSVLKQYLPLKPIKRGIKIWERCDSQTGYVYDFHIYSGREEGAPEGTLGDRVVKRLTSTVREEEVSFCFDRFFTSVSLQNTLPFACVGTCISTRKNMPEFPQKNVLVEILKLRVMRLVPSRVYGGTQKKSLYLVTSIRILRLR
ncbi:Transposase IS4 [Popillia japonica]|uniref:Transposase IS4 n=1 Tax=Popillia japonica TaxID=7064 RepID=A0AAW1I8A6_POPJA